MAVGPAPRAPATSPCCRVDDRAYVQFGDGSWRCFDLATDPTWQTEVDDPAVVLADAQAMLVWRSRHADRTLTDLVIGADGGGRLAAPAGSGGAPLPDRPIARLATVLALTSAGLHATWNLVAKRSADPFIALWGQFFVAGLIAAVVLAVTRDLPAEAWTWAAVTGAVHVPYLVAPGPRLRTG